MRIIIAGSRSATYPDLQKAMLKCDWKEFISCVLSGMAKGADKHGEQWALNRVIPIEHHPADWDTFNKAAGPIRNEEMARNAHGLIAIWDGRSNGTGDMILKARRYGLRIFIYYMDSENTKESNPTGKISNLWERITERAAIMQHCGNMPRHEAEKKAGACWDTDWI